VKPKQNRKLSQERVVKSTKNAQILSKDGYNMVKRGKTDKNLREKWKI